MEKTRQWILLDMHVCQFYWNFEMLFLCSPYLTLCFLYTEGNTIFVILKGVMAVAINLLIWLII